MTDDSGHRPIDQPGLRTRMGHESRRISSQHRQLDSLYGMIVSALQRGDREGVQRALQRFEDAFDAHISLEDSFYFPALRGMEGDVSDELAELSKEHETFREDLEALGTAFRNGSLDDASATLDDFITRVAAHEGREEALLASLTARRGG